NRAPEPVVLDIGTGSGCLAVIVAREVPGARVRASDVSEEALRVARDNAAAQGVGARIRFVAGDLFQPHRGAGLEGTVDFILANPPYLSDEEVSRSMPEVRDFEPRAALGRYLQEAIRADHDYPDFDKSLMDGYAVIAADTRTVPRSLRVLQEIPAGADPGALRAVVPGTAARIMTGAPIPPGADAVLIV